MLIAEWNATRPTDCPFERWEARQPVLGHSWARRLAHGLGFEGGLTVMLVPVMAFWRNTSFLTAFMANLGLLAFFFVCGIVFTRAFDRVFGLPQHARGQSAQHHTGLMPGGMNHLNS